jgi:L-gulonolactone oxidase
VPVTTPRGWSNWAGNQRCTPASVEHPHSEGELADLVKRAAASGRRVKVIGAGHSFTDIACTDGVQVQLGGFARAMSVDADHRLVTVEAGITIARLSEWLASEGLAMPNLGDIAYQTISGAISTATHGTGARLGGIATQVRALNLVTADGSVLSCSADREPEVFSAARVGLGALGILSTVTLECVPAFNLHAVEEPMRLDEMLEQVDELVEGNDHFEFFYVPHTRWALTKRNNRTDAPVGGMSRARELWSKIVVDNLAFGFAQRVGRRWPHRYRGVVKRMPSNGRMEYVKPSHLTFASPRLVHFYEMEYAVPRSEGANVVRAVKDYIDGSGLQITFPIEVRFTAADDIWLSTASGRDSCYVAVHVYRGTPHEQYFRAVESIMDAVGGRPHWGKLHYQSAETLRPRYPHWDDFQAVRRRLDPDARFANSYTDRVLGRLS